jgi:hypothetical protein
MKNNGVIKYILLAYGIISIAIIYPVADYYGGFLNFFRIGPGVPGGLFSRFLFFLGTGSVATILGAYGMIASAVRKEGQDRSERHWITIIRWTARTVSLLFVLIGLGIVIVNQIFRYYPRSEAVSVVPLVLGVVMFIGLGLAWKWELPGALIALIAFIGLSIVNPDLMTWLPHYIVLTTAILFLLCWWLSRSPRLAEKA